MTPNSRWLDLLILVAALFAATKYLMGIPASPTWGLAVQKSVPVVLLAAWVAAPDKRPRNWLVIAGLLASAVGDFLLELGVSTFLPGVAAFAAAHLLYLSAFALTDRRLRPVIAVPFILWGGLAYRHVYPNLGAMAVPVAAYVAIISVMMWRAAAQADRRATRRRGWASWAPSFSAPATRSSPSVAGVGWSLMDGSSCFSTGPGRRGELWGREAEMRG